MDAGVTHTICYRPRGVSRCHFSLLSVGDFQSVLASQPQMKRGLLQYQMRKSRSRSVPSCWSAGAAQPEDDSERHPPRDSSPFHCCCRFCSFTASATASY